MKSDEIAAQLDAREQEIASLAAQCEALMPAIRADMVKQAEEFIATEARRVAMENANRSVALGPEGIASLKAEVDQLIKSMPQRVADVTPRDELPHAVRNIHANAEGASTFYYGRLVQSVSGLGRILAKAKLIGNSGRAWSADHSAKEKDTFRYIGEFRAAWTPGAFRDYTAAYRKLVEGWKEIDRLRKEHASAKAAELWEST